MAMPKFVKTASTTINTSLTVIDSAAKALNVLAPLAEQWATELATNYEETAELRRERRLSEALIAHVQWEDENQEFIADPAFKARLDALMKR